MRRILSLSFLLCLLGACGGGGSGPTVAVEPAPDPTPPVAPTPTPSPEPPLVEESRAEPSVGFSARHMPVVDLDATRDRHRRILTGIRHVGADVAPLPAGTACDDSATNPVSNARWCGQPPRDHALQHVADHAGAAVSHGRIFGNAHEAMGGTLERRDLSAEFGGSR